VPHSDVAATTGIRSQKTLAAARPSAAILSLQVVQRWGQVQVLRLLTLTVDQLMGGSSREAQILIEAWRASVKWQLVAVTPLGASCPVRRGRCLEARYHA